MKTEEILNEREKTHGDFEDVAFVHDGMMDCLNHSSNVLSCAKRLAISNICLKLARIVCGDPNFADHWDDIAGYAMLGKGQKPDKDAMKKWQEMMAEKEGCFICNKNIDKPHHVLDWVNFVCDKCLKEGSENFDRIMKEAEIRQEDMPATAKAGQKFKYEGGEFVPLEGWGYCEKCDGSTQHEDGFCLRESCQKEEAKGAPCKELEEMTRLMQEAAKATSSKMEHVENKTFWCVSCEKEKLGKPQNVGIVKDGMLIFYCDDCFDKFIKALRECWS